MRSKISGPRAWCRAFWRSAYAPMAMLGYAARLKGIWSHAEDDFYMIRLPPDGLMVLGCRWRRVNNIAKMWLMMLFG